MPARQTRKATTEKTQAWTLDGEKHAGPQKNSAQSNARPRARIAEHYDPEVTPLDFKYAVWFLGRVQGSLDRYLMKPRHARAGRCLSRIPFDLLEYTDAQQHPTRPKHLVAKTHKLSTVVQTDADESDTAEGSRHHSANS